MYSEEAKLYSNEILVDNLCLIGYNDNINEIIIGDDGKMIVKYTKPIQLEDDEFIDCRHIAKGVTKIKFK